MYVGTKIVNLTPMNRAEYNAYRGWDLPANEDGSDEGYLVEYTDGGKPNDPRHKGYISWCPKEQADAAYVRMDEFSPSQIACDPVLKYFAYKHLPPRLQTASSHFYLLAQRIVNSTRLSDERAVALRKLLEAKDAAVRAFLDT